MHERTAKNILVTGGSGFIGKAFCQSLDLNLFSLRVLQRSLTQSGKNCDRSPAEVVKGDLLNPESLVEACRNIEVVVHLAGIAHVANGKSDLAQTTIVEGTRNLINAAIRNKVKRFVYLSSSLAAAVDANSADITAYGRHKKAAEDLLLAASADGAIEVVILRPVNVYGPGMKGNIATMISLIQRQRLPPLPALRTRLSLVGAADVVQALNLVLESEQASGKIYTVTDGQEYQIQDIEAAIYAELGKTFPRWRTPRVVLFAAALAAGIVSAVTNNGAAIGPRTYRNITTDNVFDNAAICRDLGFKPGTNLFQELPQIIAKLSQLSQSSQPS